MCFILSCKYCGDRFSFSQVKRHKSELQDQLAALVRAIWEDEVYLRSMVDGFCCVYCRLAQEEKDRLEFNRGQEIKAVIDGEIESFKASLDDVVEEDS